MYGSYACIHSWLWGGPFVVFMYWCSAWSASTCSQFLSCPFEWSEGVCAAVSSPFVLLFLGWVRPAASVWVLRPWKSGSCWCSLCVFFFAFCHISLLSFSPIFLFPFFLSAEGQLGPRHTASHTHEVWLPGVRFTSVLFFLFSFLLFFPTPLSTFFRISWLSHSAECEA